MSGIRGWSQAPAHPELDELLAAARSAAGSVPGALTLCEAAARVLPRPGQGRTAELWRGLAELGAVDLTVARVLEPHLDAVAILAQAAEEGYAVPPTSGTWGVYAAEGPGARLQVVPPSRPEPGSPPADPADPTDPTDPTDPARAPRRQGGPSSPTGRTLLTDRAVLAGRKPWCSLAEHVDRALVTAWVDDARRGLFAVDLRHPGVTPVDEPWAARGLRDVRSTGLDLDQVPAAPVGPPGWYLTRPGFAWGGLGVAAVWLGGAMGLARRMRRAAQQREPDQIGLALLGRVDARITAAWGVLDHAAGAVDAGLVQGEHAWPRVVRTRDVVHDACEDVLTAAAHGLGPGPSAGEAEHAARVADLQLYLRQHKAERDAAVVGQAVAQGMPTTW